MNAQGLLWIGRAPSLRACALRSSYDHTAHLQWPRACRALLTAASAKPRVVLVGWLGAQRKHLAKYEDLWQKLGHNTLCVQPRTSSVVLPPLCDRQAATFLQDFNQVHKSAPQQSTVFHIFSNAGAIFMGTVLQALLLQQRLPRQKQEHTACAGLADFIPQRLGNLAGIILDSSPARLTPDIAARGLVSATLRRPAAQVEIQQPRLTAAARLLLGAFLSVPYIVRRQEQIWQSWMHVPLCPQLYLYSSCDALIPPEEVERFMLLQKQRGAVQYTRKWPDSAHCEHFREHPEEYKQQLLGFLERLRP